jgi:hypothetical protein
MNAITHLLDDPVYDRLEACARRLMDEAGHLLSRLQTMQMDGTQDGRGETAGSSQPTPLRISGAEFSRWHTGLEREHIDATGQALERVSRTIEKSERRLTAIAAGTGPLDLTGQAAVLVEATRLLAVLVSRLRRMAEFDRARGLLGELQVCDAESTRLATENLRVLYASAWEPGRLLAVKDLIDLLGEAVEDACEGAHLVWRIFLKNN